MARAPKIEVAFNAVAFVASKGKLVPVRAASEITTLWNTRAPNVTDVYAHIEAMGEGDYCYDILTNMRGGPGLYDCWRCVRVPTVEDALDELKFFAQDDWKVLREAPSNINGSKELHPGVIDALNKWMKAAAQRRAKVN